MVHQTQVDLDINLKLIDAKVMLEKALQQYNHAQDHVSKLEQVQNCKHEFVSQEGAFLLGVDVCSKCNYRWYY